MHRFLPLPRNEKTPFVINKINKRRLRFRENSILKVVLGGIHKKDANSFVQPAWMRIKRFHAFFGPVNVNCMLR